MIPSRSALHRVAPALALIAGLTAPAWAQTTSEVQFQSGNFGTMVEGTVTGEAYVDYTLRAQAGQDMFVELDVTDSTGTGTVYFNILPPGSTGEAIYIGSMDGNTTTAPLPADGIYTIRVYQMGNDADTGKTSDYTVDLSIQ